METVTNQIESKEVKSEKVVLNAKQKREAQKAKKALADAEKAKEANSLLSKINAIGITESLKEKNAGKTIFKKEFNNKKDRTSCRTKFLSAVQMYLLHTAHNKKELADAKLKEAKEIASKYYVAECTFASVGDYATSNMEANKRSAIELFINEIKK